MAHKIYRLEIRLFVSADSEDDAESLVPFAGQMGENDAECTSAAVIDIECTEENSDEE